MGAWDLELLASGLRAEVVELIDVRVASEWIARQPDPIIFRFTAFARVIPWICRTGAGRLPSPAQPGLGRPSLPAGCEGRGVPMWSESPAAASVTSVPAASALLSGLLTGGIEIAPAGGVRLAVAGP